MELKIDGLKIDGGAISKPPMAAANKKAIAAETEQDPEKKKRLQEELKKDAGTGPG